jgi:hypothetical protein
LLPYEKKPKPERYTTINPRILCLQVFELNRIAQHPKRLKLFFDHKGLAGAAAGAGNNE